LLYTVWIIHHEQASRLGFLYIVILLTAFVGLGAVNPERLSEWAGVGLQFTTEHFGWLYLFATSGPTLHWWAYPLPMFASGCSARD
jgi:choline-glycine betaine transporter